MRRKTYAYNSIIIGILVGILAYVSTENIVLGILALLGVSIVGFVVIKLLENALYKGADMAADAAAKAIQNRKSNSAAGQSLQGQPLQMQQQRQPQQPYQNQTRQPWQAQPAAQNRNMNASDPRNNGGKG